MSYKSILVLIYSQACNDCRELGLECKPQSELGVNTCSTCAANDRPCEKTLATMNLALNKFTPHCNQTLQEYQMQLILLEQQRKKRMHMARATQETASPSVSPPRHDKAQQNHDLQMMLLEQQKKKGMLKARAIQESASSSASPRHNQARQDYELQLMLLEQQKKKRMLTSRTT